MSKTCEICGIKLSYRNSFFYKGKHLCGSCLDNIEADEGVTSKDKILSHGGRGLSSYTFNGIGSVYYGKWPISVDGKLGIIKSLFFCIIYLPLFPLGSIIVWKEQENTNFSIIFYSKSSSSMEASKIKLFWPQILNVYSGVMLIIGFFIIWISAFFTINNEPIGSSNYYYIFPFLLVPSILYIIRYRKASSKLPLWIILNPIFNIIAPLVMIFINSR